MTIRRLAAILAADVVGFSRLMGKDDEGTLERVKSLRREVVEPKVNEHHGRIFKTTGDGLLVEFQSPVEAVRCAVGVQEALASETSHESAQALQLRIGINLGDIIIEDDGDVYGEGVNVAARLEQLADPGGVCISGKIYEEVRDKLPYPFEDRGEQQVKNISRPVRVYALARVRLPAPSPVAQPPSVPDKPSIAVLPFTNMSGDPEQEYFADGIAEDIITSLARFPRLFVIARNSSFTYKGKAVDLKHVGRELGVRYVLEGSIRRAGNRVRITGQLIEAETGTHLWADRFDGDLTDIFALQDEITERVVGAIEPRLRQAEIEAAARKRPNSFAAYDLYLRALPRFHTMTRDGLDEALRLLYLALEADPRYSTAAALAALIRGYRTAAGWAANPPREMDESLRLARLAVDLDPNDPDALSCAGRMMGYAGRDYQGAIEMVDRATQLCPNSAFAWGNRGWTYVYAARPAEAVDFLQRAIRFSPLDPLRYEALSGLGLAYLQLGRYEDAADVSRKSAQLNRYFSTTFRCLAAALAHLEQLEEAREASNHLLQVEPNFTISRWDARSRWKHPAKENFMSGMRKAGLPE